MYNLIIILELNCTECMHERSKVCPHGFQDTNQRSTSIEQSDERGNHALT